MFWDDVRHVKTHQTSDLLKSTTLYTYPEPVSPHIATDKVKLKKCKKKGLEKF